MQHHMTSTRLLLLLSMVLYIGLQFIMPMQGESFIGFIALMNVVPPLYSVYVLRRAASMLPGAYGLFWRLLSWFCLLYGAASAVWYGCYLLLGHVPPSPNAADFIWNIQALLLPVAIICLLFNKRTLYRGLRYLFDALTVVLVLNTLCWSYVILPSLYAIKRHMDWITFIGTSLFPVYDLISLCMIITLFFAYRSFLPVRTWIMLGAAVILLGISDSINIMLLAKGLPFIGSWSAVVYNFGLLLLPLAALNGKGEEADNDALKPAPVKRSAFMRLYVPGFSFAALMVMALDQVRVWNGLMIGGGAAVLLILVRQVLMLKENESLVERSEQLVRQYEYMANHDMLSGLPNRRYFEERVRHALQAKDSPTITAVMLLDMDRFKYANDTYGHSAGDQIIRQAAQRLTEVIDGCGTVARQSGDEFAILLECETQPGQLSLWADRIQGAMARPFELHEHIEYLLTVSIGIAFAQAGATELELMRKADLALYRAKSQGGGRQVFYQEEMSHSLTRQLAMEQALRKAIEQNELLLHYQPQFAAESQALIGAEALIRWQPKNGPSVSPAVFIPIAEETGLIVPIGNWVTRTACRQAVAWMQQGLSQPFLISVNVSLRQFQEPDFVASIIAILEETTLPPELLVLEITESIAMSDEREAVEKLLALKDRGIQIAMDDFGTGYSSLAVLKRYQVDKLKIDQAFVRDIGENEEQSTIIEAILAMAASLKVEVIAEGVETHSQYLFLKERGCGAIQGYYFGKPLAVADFEGRFLR